MPLAPGSRCRHRHQRTVRLPLVTEFSANAVIVAETPDGQWCTRWRMPAEGLDRAAWHVFGADLIAEAQGRFARATSPRKGRAA
jgi:hypothetical protein